MTTYDAFCFQPPAPLARVVICNPDTRESWENVPMLIDSGADVTLVPREALERLNVKCESRSHEVVGFDGNIHVVEAVRLELIFVNRTYRGQFLLTDQEWGIIGRNILNTIDLALNGPKLTWSLLK